LSVRNGSRSARVAAGTAGGWTIAIGADAGGGGTISCAKVGAHSAGGAAIAGGGGSLSGSKNGAHSAGGGNVAGKGESSAKGGADSVGAPAPAAGGGRIPCTASAARLASGDAATSGGGGTTSGAKRGAHADGGGSIGAGATSPRSAGAPVLMLATSAAAAEADVGHQVGGEAAAAIAGGLPRLGGGALCTSSSCSTASASKISAKRSSKPGGTLHSSADEGLPAELSWSLASKKLRRSSGTCARSLVEAALLAFSVAMVKPSSPGGRKRPSSGAGLPVGASSPLLPGESELPAEVLRDWHVPTGPPPLGAQRAPLSIRRLSAR